MKGRKGSFAKEVPMEPLKATGEWYALVNERVVERAWTFDALVEKLRSRDLLGKVVVTRPRPYPSIL